MFETNPLIEPIFNSTRSFEALAQYDVQEIMDHAIHYFFRSMNPDIIQFSKDILFNGKAKQISMAPKDLAGKMVDYLYSDERLARNQFRYLKSMEEAPAVQKEVLHLLVDKNLGNLFNMTQMTLLFMSLLSDEDVQKIFNSCLPKLSKTITSVGQVEQIVSHLTRGSHVAIMNISSRLVPLLFHRMKYTQLQVDSMSQDLAPLNHDSTQTNTQRPTQRFSLVTESKDSAKRWSTQLMKNLLRTVPAIRSVVAQEASKWLTEKTGIDRIPAFVALSYWVDLQSIKLLLDPIFLIITQVDNMTDRGDQLLKVHAVKVVKKLLLSEWDDKSTKNKLIDATIALATQPCSEMLVDQLLKTSKTMKLDHVRLMHLFSSLAHQQLKTYLVFERLTQSVIQSIQIVLMKEDGIKHIDTMKQMLDVMYQSIFGTLLLTAIQDMKNYHLKPLYPHILESYCIPMLLGWLFTAKPIQTVTDIIQKILYELRTSMPSIFTERLLNALITIISHSENGYGPFTGSAILSIEAFSTLLEGQLETPAWFTSQFRIIQNRLLDFIYQEGGYGSEYFQPKSILAYSSFARFIHPSEVTSHITELVDKAIKWHDKNLDDTMLKALCYLALVVPGYMASRFHEFFLSFHKAITKGTFKMNDDSEVMGFLNMVSLNLRDYFSIDKSTGAVTLSVTSEEPPMKKQRREQEQGKLNRVIQVFEILKSVSITSMTTRCQYTIASLLVHFKDRMPVEKWKEVTFLFPFTKEFLKLLPTFSTQPKQLTDISINCQ